MILSGVFTVIEKQDQQEKTNFEPEVKSDNETIDETE